MNLPVVELGAGAGGDLLDALSTHGATFVRDPAVPAARFAQALNDAAALFARPDAELADLAIERSPHFRGYSVMHNERDWREQVHFGREAPPVGSPEPHWRLQGPNLWPDDSAWRSRMTAWMQATEQAGSRAVGAIAAALGVDAREWLGGLPYLVAKLIAYHPQVEATQQRPGVAAHLDFSLVTLTMQDDVGGLQVRGPDGRWRHVSPIEGTWLLHAGELLQYVTADRVRATPHRVVNPSTDRTRYSMPLFVCPALDATISPMSRPVPAPAGSLQRSDRREHVHAVLDPASPPASIAFGPAEWHRKGRNVWCATCCR